MRCASQCRPLRCLTSDRATPSRFRPCELFTARARAARPGFELTDEDAWLAAEISRLVDGLPLAIELAAARVNVLGLAEILALVRRRLELLRDQPATDAGRAALATLVEWSYDLLHADEKTLLHHVAVHRGGAPLPALVEAGAGHGLDEMTVVELLGTLVDKSIVTVSFPSAAARYDLLDTVRDYALERLAEGGGLVGCPEGARGVLRHVGGRRARRPSWTRVASVGRTTRARARQPVGRSHVRARSVRRRQSRVGWERSPGTSRSRSASPKAAASSSSHSPPRPMMLPAPLRLELEGFRCFFATEELDLDTAIEIGERALVATEPLPPQAALVEATLALALAEVR